MPGPQQRPEFFLTCERSRVEEWLWQPDSAHAEVAGSDSFSALPSHEQHKSISSIQSPSKSAIVGSGDGGTTLTSQGGSSDYNASVDMQTVKLVGFRAFIAEEWLFEDAFPDVVVQHTSNPEDSITAYRFCLDNIKPEFKQLAESFLTPQMAGFTTQSTRYGKITLISSALIPRMELTPLVSGDYESERQRIETSVLLRRVCCGDAKTKMDDQISMFWRSYGDFIAPMTSNDTPIAAALKYLIGVAQHYLIMFNYASFGSLNVGFMDRMTMNAVAVCRSDIIIYYPQLGQDKMPFPAFVDIQLLGFLKQQALTLKISMAKLKLSPDIFQIASLEDGTEEIYRQWIERLSLNKDESLIRFLPYILQQCDEGVLPRLAETRVSPDDVNAEKNGEEKTRKRSKSASSRLKKSLKKQQARCKDLEAQVSYLRMVLSALKQEVEESKTHYAELEKQYQSLLEQSDKKDHEIEDIKTAAEGSRARIKRQVAQVAESVGTAAYSVQTTAREIQQLEDRVAALSKASENIITHTILPNMLKWFLSMISAVLVFFAVIFRAIRRFIPHSASWGKKGSAANDVGPLERAQSYIEAARQWMDSLQSNDRIIAGDASAQAQTHADANACGINDDFTDEASDDDDEDEDEDEESVDSGADEYDPESENLSEGYLSSTLAEPT